MHLCSGALQGIYFVLMPAPPVAPIHSALVVCLPLLDQGGQLSEAHNRDQLIWNWRVKKAEEIGWAPLHSGYEHELWHFQSSLKST